LEELETVPDHSGGPDAAHPANERGPACNLVRRLKPLDRQVIVGYLEDLDAQSIGEITG